jgi:hypothetical protein
MFSYSSLLKDPLVPILQRFFRIHMLEPNSSNFKTCGYCFDTNFQIPDLSSPFPKLCLVPGTHYTFPRLVDCINTKF